MPEEKKEVTMDRVHEIYNELTEPTATVYTPEFLRHVYVVDPDGHFVPVPENYCLSIPSTLGLMCILEDLGPVGYLDDPQQFTSTQFEYSQRVPWLRFANGAVRNAATLAYNWKGNNGDPGGKTAEERCRQDIGWG